TSGYARTELVPGGYFEHTWAASRRVKMVSGMRLDYHNLYGLFYSPRWHTQFDFSENTVMRIAAGRGYRVPTPFIENISTLVTNRQVRLTDDLQPEVAWNFGGSFVQTAEWGSSWWQFTADYYFTHFENQLIVDRDARQDQLAFYMLDGGRSYAHSAQIGAEVKPVEWLTLKTAYKYRDVQQTIAEELRLRPLTARHIWHSVANIDREKWGLNVMLHYVGAQRLPTGPEVPDAHQTGDLSPDYWLLNVHGKYIWRWFEFYAGVENATNLQIEQPIRAADNPESPWFDAAYSWGPVMGAMPYAGIRFRLGE
ncbi:MAG: TonB-dependent receptor plug domain-containing protein, partial [Bacteroidota bacterium]